MSDGNPGASSVSNLTKARRLRDKARYETMAILALAGMGIMRLRGGGWRVESRAWPQWSRDVSEWADVEAIASRAARDRGLVDEL